MGIDDRQALMMVCFSGVSALPTFCLILRNIAGFPFCYAIPRSHQPHLALCVTAFALILVLLHPCSADWPKSIHTGFPWRFRHLLLSDYCYLAFLLGN